MADLMGWVGPGGSPAGGAGRAAPPDAGDPSVGTPPGFYCRRRVEAWMAASGTRCA